VRPPVLYTAVGLPERLDRLRGARVRSLYTSALRLCRAIVSYAESETDRLRAWLGPDGPRVAFVPFGVDTDAFRPDPRPASRDVVSVGADPHRDFGLLARIAGRRPGWSFGIVAGRDHARALGALPPNVSLESNVPLAVVREQLAAARVVALPVRDNSYSGATTTLLQAMALAKPVVVSRTGAVASGYGLADGVNCRLVSPEDEQGFESALAELLDEPTQAAAMGRRARETVEGDFSWNRFVDSLWELLDVQ
jgi:glycosyltransferase involved in cell wall biosynthesis